MSNKLTNETSPYLLQHADNPVNWYPWGDEALHRAAREDRPILLSIGYSSCHWCHVMEKESFLNPDTARIMNDNFVNIKVDREERPDLDSIYMAAVQAMTGRGGWPLTAFLTPELKPFYGGTYFPPEDRHGIPGFRRVLESVAAAYRTRRGEVESAAKDVVRHLQRSAEAQGPAEPLTADILDRAYHELKNSFDSNYGGFGGAPKFPQPMVLDFLLRYHYRTRNPYALEMVEKTLLTMARGGIHDQVGGGFHRYSVDARWVVPHFEKMLYDNALLSGVYLHAYQVTGKKSYLATLLDTINYVLGEMRDGSGGFCSSQDADSEGVEGKYYVWTPGEVLEALGDEEGGLALRCFGITEQGNFEGSNVLTAAVDPAEVAAQSNASVDELEARLATIRERLIEVRGRRVPPARDDKILTDWNSLMLQSLVEAASVLERSDYMEAARSNAEFLIGTMFSGGVLKHSYRNGQAKVDGYLADYALLARSLLTLYQRTAEEKWLSVARELAGLMVEQFWDESGGRFYDTSKGHGSLVVRPRDIYDNAQPSGSSAAAGALVVLARLTGAQENERIAGASLRLVKNSMARYPSAFGNSLSALDFYLSPPAEIVIIGRAADHLMQSFVRTVHTRYLPDRVVACIYTDREEPVPDIPLLRDRKMIENLPTAYLCERYACRVPVTSPEELANFLNRPE